jgi:hypothetical protein
MEELNILHTVLNLGPSGILGFIAFKLWNVYQTQLEYNREQDKLNLEQSQKLLTFLDKILDKQGSGDETTHNLIKDLKSEIIVEIQRLSQHIINSK